MRQRDTDREESRHGKQGKRRKKWERREKQSTRGGERREEKDTETETRYEGRAGSVTE